MNIGVTIGGNDVSDSLITYQRDISICTGEATLNLKISDPGFTIDTWDTVIPTEEGNTKGRFNVEEVIYLNTGEVEVSCKDNSKRLIDFYDESVEFTDTITNSKDWIQTYLAKAGVSYSFTTSEVGQLLPPGSTFGPDNIMSIVTPLITMNGWYMYFNNSGTAVIGPINFDPSSYDLSLTESSIISINTDKNDEDCRNRVVVWNAATGTSIAVQVNTDWMQHANDYRTVVVANSNIRNSYHAWRIAGQILGQFTEPEFVKVIQTDGSPNVYLGDGIHVRSRTWSGVGVLTSISVYMDSGGYTTTLTLDEKCPRMLGTFLYNGYVYIGTWGSGVWRKPLDGSTWENFSAGLGNLNILDLHVNNGAFVCVANDGYAYVRDLIDSSWRVVNHGTFDGFSAIATSCIFRRSDSLAYITYAYDGTTTYKSWVAQVDLFGTIQSYEQITTFDTEEYYAYDIDKNETTNFISAYVPVDLVAVDTGIVNKTTHHEVVDDPFRDGYNVSVGPQTAHDPVTSPLEAADVIDNVYFASSGGTFIGSNFVINDNEVFVHTVSGFHYIDYSQTPINPKVFNLGINTYGANGYAFLSRKNTNSFDIVMVKQPVGYEWEITEHKNVEFVSGFLGINTINTYSSHAITDLGDGESNFSWTHPLMVGRKIYFFWISNFTDGRNWINPSGAPNYWIAVYDIDDRTLNRYKLNDVYNMSRYTEDDGGVDIGQASVANDTGRPYIHWPMVYRSAQRSIVLTLWYNTDLDVPGFTEVKSLETPPNWTPRWSFSWTPTVNGCFIRYLGYNHETHENYYYYHITKYDSTYEFCTTWNTKSWYRQEYGVFSTGSYGIEWADARAKLVDPCHTGTSDDREPWYCNLPTTRWLFNQNGTKQHVIFYNNNNWWMSDAMDARGFYDADTDVIIKEYNLPGDVWGGNEVKTQDSSDGTIYMFQGYDMWGFDSDSGTITKKVANWSYGFIWQAPKGVAIFGKYLFNSLANNTEDGRRVRVIALIDAEQWFDNTSVNRVLKHDGSFTVLEENLRLRYVETSVQDPLVIYTPALSGTYLPGGFVIPPAGNPPTTSSRGTDAGEVYYTVLEAVNSAKTFNLYDIELFSPTISGPGNYMIVASGEDILMRSSYLANINYNLTTFSGSVVTKLETTQAINPPYIFATIIPSSGIPYSGGIYFKQRDPESAYFTDYTPTMPQSEVTIIRVDDIL